MLSKFQGTVYRLIDWMCAYNERLFYLLSVKKLVPGHVMPTYRANALDSKLCYSKF